MGKFWKRVERLVFSRMLIVGMLIALQLFTLLLFVLRLSNYFAAMYAIFAFLSVIAVLYVVNKDDNPSYKLAWVIPILLFPLFGGLFYLMFGGTRLRRRSLMRNQKIRGRMAHYLPCDDPKLLAQLGEQSVSASPQAHYLARVGFPVFENTDTLYLSPGEKKFEAMCEALREAKRYIFLEYFIVQEGVMWNTILAILEDKVKEGVEVRMMYDGFGCLTTLPDGYYKVLRAKGMKCIEFNPLIPMISLIMNNRDHRKILVIDGDIGFMGGVNLADEYINVISPHGYWKDSAVELRGDAVWSLVVMFLSLWEGVTGQVEDMEHYRADHRQIIAHENGLVQPYADSPLDRELVGEMVYMGIINHARNYLYICTPYLIIDNELAMALTLAAKSGVDVRIITPGEGDKWYVHMTTRAYYSQLLNGGVKIYEYEPGFIHSKTFVADDEVGTVGTVNLDYRSLYLHFECGVWMYKTSAVAALHDDFLETLQHCVELTPDSPLVRGRAVTRIMRAVLRLFAPLM